MNKHECIDDIIKRYGSAATYVNHNPEYKIPKGLPNIDLEIRTPERVEQYVLVDMNTSADVVKDIGKACDALRHAAQQVAAGRMIYQWIQLYNIDNVKLKKYEPLIAKLLMKKVSTPLQQQPKEDMPLCSTARHSCHQTEKSVLN
ncbi:MAG: hypothetical protein QW165_02445 [Candidatus Woesearchaeota archaeon]